MSQQEINRKEAGVDDNPKLLSPPVVTEPLYQCATAVVVVGGVTDSEIEVEVNGSSAGSGFVQTVLPYGITIGVPQLIANDKVRARQKTATAISDWSSPEVIVRDHTQDYPAGPPRPEIFPLPLYKCGVRTGVGNLLIGGNVWVTANGAEVGRVNGCGNPQGVNIAPPFSMTQKVRAWFELCGDPSPPSIEHTTGAPPSPLPAPIIAQQYGGGNQLEISNIANGAKVTVNRGGVVQGTWGCWGGSIRLGGFTPNFSSTEIIEAFQSMCPGDPPSDSGTMTVEPCSNLPAPQVGPIQGGDTAVFFTQYAPGATLSVWLNGAPVGKGGGPLVPLNKTIAFGDTVIVAQDLPGCQGQRALKITVPCVDPPVAGDPSATNLFPVSVIDFSNGPNKGRIYYPAEDDGTGIAFNKRLAALGRVPLVVMAHGNHDPGVPNYLGYDYFQADLAKMGFVAISVDCNAQNGMGYSIAIIERRADLIIGAISVMQQLDTDAASVLFGRIDFSRVGLMGHSQGGEAVVLVPEVIGLPGVSIRSVIALAPTEGGATKRTPKDYAFMTILPASDGDVWPNDGAIYYDRAVPSPFKSQLFVHFTNHQFYNRQWLDDDSLWGNAAPTPPVQSRYAHERVLTAYGCAFYRATLLGHSTASYLAGKLLPAGVATQHVQLSFEQAEVVTVDNHEDGNGIGKNSLGAPTQQLGGLNADEFQFHQGSGAFNGSFFGSSVGMVASPGGNGRLFIQDLAGKHNLANKEIWVRVAEVFVGQTVSGPSTGFQLGLRDANGVESWLDSDDVGGLPRPFPRNPATMKTMLKTLRFKSDCLAVNSKLDLSSITAILLRCNRKDELALAFDDLQIVAT
jgi:dienelactone hydrolase